MNKEQIFIHLEKARSLDWDELANTMIHLDIELYELGPNMSESQKQSFIQMISIYEMVRQECLNKLSRPWNVRDIADICGTDECVDY
jgi:hypothetical protein